MAIHKTLADSELHEPKGMQTLVSGFTDVGKVAVSKGDGTSEVRKLIASEVGALSAGTALKTITQASDFGTPLGGNYILTPGCVYIITNDINLGSNGLLLGAGNAVVSLGQIANKITYTGSNALFNSTGDHCIESLIVDCGGSGQVFEHQESASSFCNYNDIVISNCNKIGNWVGGFNSLISFESVYCATSMSNGISFVGQFGLLTANDGSFIVNGTSSCINLGTAVFGGITLQGTAITIAGATTTGISGAAGSANLGTGDIGKIINCFITNPGGGTILSGITETDTQWRFFNSTLTKDTRPDALLGMRGNVTATTINVGDGDAANPKKVAGSYTNHSMSQFLFDISGRATFDGDIDQTLPIDISVSAIALSGNPTAKFYIAINGSAVLDSQVFTSLGSTPVSAHCIWQHTFTKGDYVEVFVSNESNTTNITADTVVIRLN